MLKTYFLAFFELIYLMIDCTSVQYNNFQAHYGFGVIQGVRELIAEDNMAFLKKCLNDRYIKPLTFTH